MDLYPPPAVPAVREISLGDGARGLEVSVPLRVNDQPWGTLRTVLSLTPVWKDVIPTLGEVAATGVALLLLGTLGAAWLARLLSEPNLRSLQLKVAGTVKICLAFSITP